MLLPGGAGDQMSESPFCSMSGENVYPTTWYVFTIARVSREECLRSGGFLGLEANMIVAYLLSRRRCKPEK